MKRNKLFWLKKIILIKAAACIFLWGLPTLLGPSALFHVLGLTMPQDTAYLRLFGSLVTALGLLYWYAYKNPIKNSAIIRYAIFDNGLAALTLAVLVFTGKGNWMFAVSAIFAFFFFISFIWLFPDENLAEQSIS